MITAKILKDTKEDIQFELGINDNNCYFVECYLLDEDSSDTYSIHIYDTLHQDVNPYNENEIMYGWFDSDGGTFEGFDIYLDLEKNDNEKLVKLIEENVLDILFNDKNGLIHKHWIKN